MGNISNVSLSISLNLCCLLDSKYLPVFETAFIVYNPEQLPLNLKKKHSFVFGLVAGWSRSRPASPQLSQHRARNIKLLRNILSSNEHTTSMCIFTCGVS